MYKTFENTACKIHCTYEIKHFSEQLIDELFFFCNIYYVIFTANYQLTSYLSPCFTCQYKGEQIKTSFSVNCEHISITLYRENMRTLTTNIKLICTNIRNSKKSESLVSFSF